MGKFGIIRQKRSYVITTAYESQISCFGQNLFRHFGLWTDDENLKVLKYVVDEKLARNRYQVGVCRA